MAVEPVELACANCGKRFRVSGRAGKRFKCSKCGNEMTVPDKVPPAREGVAYCSYCWKAFNVKGRPAGTRFNCTSCGQPISVGAREKKKTSRAATAAPKNDAFHEDETMVIQPAAGADPVAAAERAEQRKELDVARAELIETRKAFQNAKAEVEKWKNEVEKLTGQVRQKEQEGSAAASKLDEVKTKRAGLEKESQRLRSELASAASASAEQAGKTKGLEEKLRHGEETAKEQLRRIEEQSGRIAEIEKELSSRVTKEEMEQFHTEKRELNEKADTAARKVASFRERLKGFLNPARELVRRYEEMEAQASDTGLPDFTRELEHAREEARAKQEEADSLRAAHESLQAEMGSLKREIEARNSVIAGKEREIAERDERIEELTRPPEEPARKGVLGSLAGLFSRKKERPSGRGRAGKEKEEDLEEIPEIPEPIPEPIEESEKAPAEAEGASPPDESPTDKRKPVRPRRSRRKKRR